MRSALARSVLVGMTGVAALASSGCVSKVNYDRLAAESAKAKGDAEARQQDDAAKLLALQQQLTAAEAQVQDRDSRLSDLSTASHNVQAQLDEETAINQQMRGELQRLGKDVDKILAERGTLSKALDDAKTRLEELRKAQAAAEARVALFRDFERRFKPLEDAGQVHVESRRGQLVLEVQGDLLFEPGRDELRSTGKGALMEIARTLQVSSSPGASRRYLVTSHVDPQDQVAPPVDPKERPRAASSRAAEARKAHRPRTPWELTVAQAVAVVEYLVSLGVPPDALTAAGAGSFDPVAGNETAEARTKNRRIEIALMPTAG